MKDNKSDVSISSLACSEEISQISSDSFQIDTSLIQKDQYTRRSETIFPTYMSESAKKVAFGSTKYYPYPKRYDYGDYSF